MKYEEEQEERARLVALYPGPVHAETIDMLMDTRRTVKENHRWVQAELDALDREEEIKREIPKIALKFALWAGAFVFVIQMMVNLLLT